MHASRHILFFLAFVIAIATALPIQKAPSLNLAQKEKPIMDGGIGDASSKAESGGKLKSLLAFPHTNEIWTTSSGSPGALPLSDATLRPTDEIKSLTHNYVKDPSGLMSMEAVFPQGSVAFGHEPKGGISFYAPGPASVDLTTAKEAIFGYSVYFEEGFEWNKGGKLPGLYGGNTAEGSTSCSGGRRSTECFSARFMWRGEGAGELYTYLPNYQVPGFEANKAVCDVKPMSDCNPTYGASVGRGSFSFAGGSRTIISERVRLNTAGQADGELEVTVNGQSVISVKGLILRDSDEGRIRGIQWQTFFGGHDSSFASPKDQKVWFSDVSLAISEKL